MIMKKLALALSLVSASAMADTNGVYNLPRQRSFTHATISFSPSFADTTYQIKLKSFGGLKGEKATAAMVKPGSFVVFCAVGTTNLVWSVKAK